MKARQRSHLIIKPNKIAPFHSTSPSSLCVRYGSMENAAYVVLFQNAPPKTLICKMWTNDASCNSRCEYTKKSKNSSDFSLLLILEQTPYPHQHNSTPYIHNANIISSSADRSLLNLFIELYQSKEWTNINKTFIWKHLKHLIDHWFHSKPSK